MEERNGRLWHQEAQMSKRPINVEVTLDEVRGDQIRLIKRFVKKTKKSGIIDEYKERMYFERS